MDTLKLGVVGLILASLALALQPGPASAQCDGGGSVAGYYRPNGAYISGAGCGYTSAGSLGQIYPSGARPGLLPGGVAATGQLGPVSVLGPLAGGPLMGAEINGQARGNGLGLDARPGAAVNPPRGLALSALQVTGGEAYGYSLGAAPPATTDGIRLASESAPPPAPGRGGVTYVGQELDNPPAVDDRRP
jgi:hypothetical protein